MEGLEQIINLKNVDADILAHQYFVDMLDKNGKRNVFDDVVHNVKATIQKIEDLKSNGLLESVENERGQKLVKGSSFFVSGLVNHYLEKIHDQYKQLFDLFTDL